MVTVFTSEDHEGYNNSLRKDMNYSWLRRLRKLLYLLKKIKIATIIDWSNEDIKIVTRMGWDGEDLAADLELECFWGQACSTTTSLDAVQRMWHTQDSQESGLDPQAKFLKPVKVFALSLSVSGARPAHSTTTSLPTDFVDFNFMNRIIGVSPCHPLARRHCPQISLVLI